MTHHVCPRGAPEVLIGEPIDNTAVWLLERSAQRLAPIGTPAEIYFGGILAAGYLAQPDLTAARFVSNPMLCEASRSALQLAELGLSCQSVCDDAALPASPILFRTADLAVRLPSGELRYVGRIDRQVKLRGFRVELGEVEHVARSFWAEDPVELVAVVIDCSLVLFVAVDALSDDTSGLLHAHCQSALPPYMVPRRFICVPSLPRLSSGKVDAVALQNGDLDESLVARAFSWPVATSTSCCQKASVLLPHGRCEDGAPCALRPLWRRHLEASVLRAANDLVGPSSVSLTAETPLMDAGVDSLAAMELSSRLSSLMSLVISPTIAFEQPTPRAIAVHLFEQAKLTRLPTSSGQTPPAVTPTSLASLALLGMTGRWPGGCCVEVGRWALHCACGDAVGCVPLSRWMLPLEAETVTDVCNSAKKHVECAHHGGFVSGAQCFDAAAFAVSAAEAGAMDPQQRLLLELGYAALHSSYRRILLMGSGSGVFLGIEQPDWALVQPPAARCSVYALTGDNAAVAAGRVSYTLGLHGPCLSVDTACSSALAAMQGAANDICTEAVGANSQRRHPSNLVAAVSLQLAPYGLLAMASAGMISMDGRCKTLDARANGYVRSEGVGTFVLEPVMQTVRLKAIAMRQDGRSASLTAPNGSAQRALLAVAYRSLVPTALGCVEAHGTGTPLGDPTEVGALAAAHNAAADGPFLLGAAKASVGHTDASAGQAGLLRVNEASTRRTASGNAQLRSLSPIVGARLRSSVASVLSPIQAVPSSLAVRGVSAFGYSGTITHAVLTLESCGCRREARSAYHIVDSANALAYRRCALCWCNPPHPFIQRRLPSSDCAVVFRSAATKGFHSLIADHIVQHRSVFPGAGYLEMARAATAASSLVGVFFLQVMAVEQSALLVDWVLFNGRFEVHSRRTGHEGAVPTVHCSGAVSAREALQPVDHARACSSVHAADSSGALYDAYSSVGLQYGPGFRTLSRAWGGTCCVAQLARRTEWQGTHVHPADLDGALQLGAVSPSVPFAVDTAQLSSQLTARALPVRGLVMQQHAGASLVAMASINGHTEARMDGFKARPLRTEAQPNERRWRYEVEWVCLAHGASSPSAPLPELLVVGAVPAALPTEWQALAYDSSAPFSCVGRCATIFAASLWASATVRLGELRVIDAALCLVQGQAYLDVPQPLWFCTTAAMGQPASPPSGEYRHAGLWGFARTCRHERTELAAWCVDVRDQAADVASLFRQHTLRLPGGSVRALHLGVSVEPEVAVETTALCVPRLVAPYDAKREVVDISFAAVCCHVDAHMCNAMAALDMTLLTPAYALLDLLCQQYLHMMVCALNETEVLAWHHKLLYAWCARQPPPPPSGHAIVSTDVHAAHQGLWAEVQLAERCGPLLARALSGAVAYHELLFPGGSMHAVLPIYEDAPIGVFYNGCLVAAIQALLPLMSAERQVVAIEIGAGTGGTASSVLPIFERVGARYVFTDVSSVFLRQARDRFDAFRCVEYALLNIDANPRLQGLAPQQCDIAIATNVLHATPSVRNALCHCAQLIRPGGMLIANDACTTDAFTQISFGLTDGWWLFLESRDPERAGQDSPLPCWRQWEALLASSGFRHSRCMQGDLFLRAQAVMVAEVAAPPGNEHRPAVLSDGAHFLSGGLGGLGLLTARLLVEGGALHLILSSRSDRVLAGSQGDWSWLAESKANVWRIRCNTSDSGAVRSTMRALRGDDRQVGGILHAAHQLADAIVANQQALNFRAAYGAKVQGATALQATSWRAPLQHFNVCSSIAGLMGSAGQAPHAAANSWIDAMASWRRRSGVCGQSVNWGAVSEVGYAARVGADKLSAATGYGAVSRTMSIAALRSTLQAGCRNFTTLPADWMQLLGSRSEATGLLAPYVHLRLPHLLPQRTPPATMTKTSTVELELVLELVRHTVGGYVDADAPLMEAGIDSLGAVELRKQLQLAVGDCTSSLSSTLIFDHPTARELMLHSQGHQQLAFGTIRAGDDVRTADPIPVHVQLVGRSATLPSGVSELRDMSHCSCDLLQEIPVARWDVTEAASGLASSPAETASRVRHGGFLRSAELFERRFFSISSAEAAAIDPQQRQLLEHGYSALHAAGMSRAALPSAQVAVNVGQWQSEYASHLTASAGHGVYALTGFSCSVTCGRVSFALDLHGPCASYDTACSASLVANHGSVRALQRVECGSALSAGANMILDAVAMRANAVAGFLSVRGRSHTFDARADGYARSEAIDVVTSCRGAGSGDASSGTRMAGSAVRQDGRSASLTAPNGQAQQALLDASMVDARVLTCQVTVLEAHGTGTALGDPIEAGAVATAFLARHIGSKESLHVGSLKANAGHTEPGAGVAGALKLWMQLKTSSCAPNAQLCTLNPHVRGSRSGGAACGLPTQLARASPGRVQAGGASSFGYAGTIAHLVLLHHVVSRVPSAGPLPPLAYRRSTLPWCHHPLVEGLVASARASLDLGMPSSGTRRHQRGSSLESCVVGVGKGEPEEGRLGVDRSGKTGAEVHLSVDLGIAIIELNDPEHFNSFSDGLGACMRRTLQHIGTLPSVISVLLQGAGPHFSVGGNPYDVREGLLLDLTSFGLSLRELYDGFMHLRTLPCPILAAAHGSVVGGGVAGFLHADYRVADCGSTFEHGNIVRGVCVLGMLSRTFDRALGSHSQQGYLLNIQLGAAAALTAGLVHRLCSGVHAARSCARGVAGLVSDRKHDLCKMACYCRDAIVPAILTCEAIGHSECQRLNGGFAKSRLGTHMSVPEGRLDRLAIFETGSAPIGPAATILPIAFGAGDSGETAELKAEQERLRHCRIQYAATPTREGKAPRTSAHSAPAMAFDAATGVAAVSTAGTATASALEAVLCDLASLGRALRAATFDVPQACVLLASLRMMNRHVHVLDELRALHVPLVCSTESVAGLNLVGLAVWSAADYRIASTRRDSLTVRKASTNEGGVSPLKSALRLHAVWLAHHPPVGTQHMLRLTRHRRLLRYHATDAKERISLPCHAASLTEMRLSLAAQLACNSLPLVSSASAQPAWRRVGTALSLPRPTAPCSRTPYSDRGVTTCVCAFEVYTPRHRANAASVADRSCQDMDERTLPLATECYTACGEDEDVVSIALTATHQLLRRGVRTAELGALHVHVNAEALDRSKSLKTELAMLAEGCDGCEHMDAEGIDCIGAATAGASSSLLSCMSWLGSESWDGRWAVAVYSRRVPSPAAGAVLVGRDRVSPWVGRDNVLEWHPSVSGLRLVLPYQQPRAGCKVHTHTHFQLDAGLTPSSLLTAEVLGRSGSVQDGSKLAPLGAAEFMAMCAQHTARHGRFSEMARLTSPETTTSRYQLRTASSASTLVAQRSYVLRGASTIAYAPPQLPAALSVLPAPSAAAEGLAINLEAVLLNLQNAQPVRSVGVGKYLGLVSTAIHEVVEELVPSVSVDMPLMEAGIDSLGAIAIRERLTARLQSSCELPETLAFDFPTLRQMEEHISKLVARPPPRAQARMPTAAVLRLLGPLLDEIAPPASVAWMTKALALKGSSCRLPGGLISSRPGLAHATVTGHDMAGAVPSLRWEDAATQRSQLDLDVMDRVRHGAFIIGAEAFDDACFAIATAEVGAMDPQQRVLLESGYAALHTASFSKNALSGSGIGVALGIHAAEYAQLLADTPLWHSVYVTNNSLSIASGRLSYALGLHGPCASFETACSASLVAVHSAARALQHGECRAHVAAGVNLMLLQANSIAMAIGGMTSLKGRCHTFDSRADGFARAEGCVAIVIHISDVRVTQPTPCGSAIRQDGRSASLTAPNGQAQQGLLRAALQDSHVDVSAISSNEAHGTGTALGDTIEAGSLAAVLLTGQRSRDPLVSYGIKAMLGHGESTAGACGLLRMSLGLARDEAPPNAQLRALNPLVGGAMRSNRCAVPCQSGRLATGAHTGGVSSFGYAGTIAHVVVRHVGAHAAVLSFAHTLMARRRAFPWHQRQPACKLTSQASDHEQEVPSPLCSASPAAHSGQILEDPVCIADLPLMAAGLTSLTSTRLAIRLSKIRGASHVSPTLVFDFPTVRAIANHLADEGVGHVACTGGAVPIHAYVTEMATEVFASARTSSEHAAQHLASPGKIGIAALEHSAKRPSELTIHGPLAYSQKQWLTMHHDASDVDHEMSPSLLISVDAGAVSSDFLASAIRALCSTHDTLRTTYYMDTTGRLCQRVIPDRAFTLPISYKGAPESSEAAKLMAVQFIRRGCDLFRGPPLHCLLMRAASNDGGSCHWVALALHHIAVDASSVSILLTELSGMLERNCTMCRTPTWPFVEYCLWQRALFERERAHITAYWAAKSGGFVLSRAEGFCSPIPVEEHADRTVALDVEYGRLHAAAQNLSVTVPELLYTLFSFLACWLLQGDPPHSDRVQGPTAQVVAGREDLPSMQEAVGPFFYLSFLVHDFRRGRRLQDELHQIAREHMQAKLYSRLTERGANFDMMGFGVDCHRENQEVPTFNLIDQSTSGQQAAPAHVLTAYPFTELCGEDMSWNNGKYEMLLYSYLVITASQEVVITTYGLKNGALRQAMHHLFKALVHRVAHSGEPASFDLFDEVERAVLDAE